MTTRCQRCLRLLGILWFSTVAALSADEGSAIVYVDRSVPAGGANDGSTWQDAFRYLQDALAVAQPDSQIRVATGTYYPDLGNGQTRHSRGSTFRLRSGVSIIGGFPSGGAPLDLRDPGAEPTVLSGNIGSSTNRSDNVYHVITATGVDRSARLDGFTISGGYARQSNFPHNSGGAVICDGSGSPSFSRCLFIDNEAGNEGGALYSSGDARPLVTDCVFEGNRATLAGGAVSNHSSVGEFNNCQFTSNQAEFGGAFYNAYSQTVASNCSFEANDADYGGAVYNFDFRSQDDPTFVQCRFVGNRAYWGGAMYGWSSAPVLRNCCLQGNQAINGGGALLNTNGWGAYLYNSIIWNNSAAGATDTSSATLALYSDSEFFAYNSIVANSGGSENWNRLFDNDRGGNLDIDPLFTLEVDPSTAPASGGDLRLLSGSPGIDAGRNELVAEGNLTDIRGAPRIIGAAVDLGIFESVPELVPSEIEKDFGDGLSVKIAITELLASVSGGLGLPLSLAAVGEPSPTGSQVRISGDYVIYTPAAGDTAQGGFTFQASDGFQIAEGSVRMIPRGDGKRSTQNIISIAVEDGSAVILGAGIPGRTYQLEASTDLRDWSMRGDPQTCPPGGTMTFHEPGPLPDNLYFRLIPAAVPGR